MVRGRLSTSKVLVGSLPSSAGPTRDVQPHEPQTLPTEKPSLCWKWAPVPHLLYGPYLKICSNATFRKFICIQSTVLRGSTDGTSRKEGAARRREPERESSGQALVSWQQSSSDGLCLLWPLMPSRRDSP